MERFLNDLSKVWNKLSKDTQDNLARLIVGERNSDSLNILMNK